MIEQWDIALVVLALGTYLLRMLPLWWTRRHLNRQAGAGLQLPLWLTVLGPAMIAAMLGVSLLPANLTAASLLATLFACLSTVLVWRRTRSLGWPVVLGVLCYGGVFMLSRLALA